MTSDPRTDEDRVPAESHWYPTPSVSDRSWDRIVAALRAQGNVRDGHLADLIEASVQEQRRRRRDRTPSA